MSQRESVGLGVFQKAPDAIDIPGARNSTWRSKYQQGLRLFLLSGCLALGLVWPAIGQSGPLDALSDSAKSLGLNLFQDELLPADQAFRVAGEVEDPRTLRLDWQIAEGYYLYRKQFKVEKLVGGVRLGDLKLPPGESKDDPEFGITEVYHRQVTGSLPLQRLESAATELKIQVRYQGCAERGVCYPPITKTLTFSLPAEPTSASSTAALSQPPLAEQDRIAQTLKDQSFWFTLISFLGFGVLLAFTPCCFPMLPILSGIIVGHGHRITTARAFGLSTSYVFASALTYTVFGILAGLFGANLQAAFQNPWVIAAFSALFAGLALSMFGLYELQMPSAWQSRLASWRGTHGGSFVNAAVMGVLSALIVGPCVAAPLAGALIYIGQTGDAVLGGAALFAMGLGMGLPLIAVGTSAGKLLPRAGLWMTTVKAVFGVLLLGVAIWLLDRILPPSVMLFLWALWLIFPAIYLGAASPLPENAPHNRKLGKALGVVMLTYGILLLIGVATGSRNVFRPLEPLTARIAPTASAETDSFRRITSPEELDTILRTAGGRWTLVDFYADWCVSCKELETVTFADAKVLQALTKMVSVRADVTANGQTEQNLLHRFDLIGPPALLFFDPEGRECKSARLIGYIPPKRFLSHLANLERYC
ncbi:protein-disulfide reductase DsbD [Methylohalobius crimeensis]|uniref:protein-disulfide reductase DsbD n=1 Tax=Methylohalobius crimeensis TaxID=244365 RepID=UPI0003B784F6|nr:protein-disulfide reductase DsbD [Methylohalobius crimeensis]